jgi:hypothetical protein
MTSSDSTNEHSTGSEYMNVLAEMTEKMTEQTLSTINRNQQAVIEAVSNWAQTTQSMIPTPPSPETLQAMPQPTELVDRGFEIAEQLLAAQHSFAKKLMESVQGPMSDAAAKTASAAQDVSDAGAASTRAAGQGANDASHSVTQTVKDAFAKD